MSLLGFSCRPCSAADPTSDTVKIDMEGAMREQQEERDTRERIEGEVRAAREVQDREDQERVRQLEEQREANARAQAEALAQAEAAADVEASLKRKQIEEAEASRRQEADARRFAEGQRKDAEEEATKQRQKQIEETRIAQEAKERAAEAVAAQEAEMKGKLDKLLKEYGVAEVNQKKKSLMSFKYPLHYAVEKSDTEAVRLLLHFKADASLLNSSKKTVLQLAEKNKMKDEPIISLLRAA